MRVRIAPSRYAPLLAVFALILAIGAIADSTGPSPEGVQLEMWFERRDPLTGSETWPNFPLLSGNSTRSVSGADFLSALVIALSIAEPKFDFSQFSAPEVFKYDARSTGIHAVRFRFRFSTAAASSSALASLLLTTNRLFPIDGSTRFPDASDAWPALYTLRALSTQMVGREADDERWDTVLIGVVGGGAALVCLGGLYLMGRAMSAPRKKRSKLDLKAAEMEEGQINRALLSPSVVVKKDNSAQDESVRKKADKKNEDAERKAQKQEEEVEMKSPNEHRQQKDEQAATVGERGGRQEVELEEKREVVEEKYASEPPSSPWASTRQETGTAKELNDKTEPLLRDIDI